MEPRSEIYASGSTGVSLKEIYKLVNQDHKDLLFSCGLSTELFLEYALGVSAEDIVHDVEPRFGGQHLNKIMLVLNELEKGQPIQYAAHRAFFYGNEFYVDENVLIPRFDTEPLVSEAISVVKTFAASQLYDRIDILEIGCGSGAPFASVLNELLFDEQGFELVSGEDEPPSGSLERTDIRALATDVSELAIKIAKRNLASLLPEIPFLDDLFKVSDLFSTIKDSTWDVIYSNPPYISDDEYEQLPHEVKKEPEIALRAGKTGLDVINSIINKGFMHLNPGGILLLEVGYDQSGQVAEMAISRGYNFIKLISDIRDVPRVIVLERPAFEEHLN